MADANIELLKRKRRTLRTATTKALNSLNVLLDDVTSGTADLTVAYGLTNAKQQELESIEALLIAALQEGSATEQEIEKEYDENDAYKSRFLLAKYKFDGRIAARSRPSSERRSSVSSSPSVSGGASQEARKNYPKIEIAKFSGNIRDWLKFWSLFKKIHEDTKLDNEDKFQYLIQAMVTDSRAAELVNSYPPTGENYEKVIDSLKKRFGCESLQIEVYVRELLQLVLQNAISTKEIPLASLYDKIETHLRALETLGVTTDKCAAMLFPLVESSLPEELLRVWQRSNNASEMNATENLADVSKNRLTKLIKFLEAEVQSEQRISMAVQGFRLEDDSESERSKKKRTQSTGRDVPSARNLLTKGKEIVCIFCEKNDHDSAKCYKAKNMSLEEKQDAIKKQRACFRCLKIGHSSRFCRVNVKCSKCTRRHVDVMCFGEQKHEDSKDDKSTKTVSAVNMQEECNLASSSEIPTTFMQTLKVKMRSDSNEIIVRAVIDTGSQNSYVLKEIADKLQYKPLSKQNMVHLLFGGEKSGITTHNRFSIRVGNLDGSYWCNFAALDEKVICSDVPSVTKGVWLQELQNLNVELTDVCSKERTVAILIGADVAGKLLTGRVHVLESGLTAVETYLGWTLMGKVPSEGPAINGRVNLAVSAISMLTSEADIKDLWSLDVLGIRDPIEHKTRIQHDAHVERAFMDSVVKNSEDRYEVRLPWLECHPELKDNKMLALRQLEPMQKKLQVAGKYEEYDGIFKDWLKEGIIERVPPEEENSQGFYIPHRPIYKENSTTSTRPIYNASVEGKGKPSLNSCLEKGPNLIELVSAILLRFREGCIGVISDIRKAFLQISIHPAERDFLRFLWYDADGNIIIYRHCRVVFGVSSSPFILGAIIKLHLTNIINSCIAQKIDNVDWVNTEKLKRSFYVDNCVTSVNSVNELNAFMSNSKTVMDSGKFDLRGWEYTNDDVLEGPTNVLGLLWDKQLDALSLNVKNLEKLDFEKITKRNILSVAHRIFDPLGFVCPVALGPKILLQEAWAAKLSWDEEVSDDIKQRFTQWINELKNLSDVKIPRRMLGIIDETSEISLHTFVDASKLAYAAVIFIRVQKGAAVNVYFVQAKTRVAPASKDEANSRTSIPRLELLAATIGARLATQVIESLDFKHLKLYYWSDSSTVVTWIQRENNWSVFVANRVKEINKLTDAKQWRHIPGHRNPADLPSRGCTVNQLLASRWWEGPDWLKERVEDWPTAHDVNIDEAEVNSELKKSASAQYTALISARVNIVEKDSLFYSFSSYSKVIRVIGWIKRFFYNCKKRIQFRKVKLLTTDKDHNEEIDLIKDSFLTADEYCKAEIVLIKMIQSKHFGSVEDESIKDFLPFTDEQGIIRTKSKLLHREDSFNFRCPVILPSKEYFVELLIKEKHVELKHAGSAMTLNVLREKFWIMRGRKLVREMIQKCIDCRRHDSKQINAHTAPLPLDRVRDAAIFEVVGVDFAGPIYLKGGQKAWICIFTCAVYRAVHLELVNSLNVASFLMALRRHIARRGRPSMIFSDNGTNFVGLNNQLKSLDYEKIAKKLAIERIEWRFNPPSAPWWGGFWERLIGVLKRLLRRTLKKSCLNYEEMLTTLIDCEAVINSRPITYLYDSHNEIVPLTPSMFLQEVTEIGVVDLDKLEKVEMNKRFTYRQKIKQDLRQRFRNEYLGALTHQKRKGQVSKELKIGDIVLVGSDNAKRIDWLLAKVKELFTGRDGHVRVARLITATGEITRPIQRLHPLELNSDYNNDIIKQTVKESGKSVISEQKSNAKEQVKETTTRSGRISKQPERLTYI